MRSFSLSKSRKYIRSHAALEVLFFSSLAVLMSTLYASRRIVYYDFNFMQNAIYRMEVGQLPYTDFDLVLPPVSFLIIYAITQIFSTSILMAMYLSSCLVLFIATFSVIGILNVLEKKFHLLKIKRNRYLILTLCSVFNVISVYPNYVYDSAAAAFSLSAVYFFLKSLDDPKISFLLNCGLASSLAVYSKYNAGIPLLIGFIVATFTINAPRIKADAKILIQKSVIIASPTLAIGIILIAIFSNDFIYQTITAPGEYKGIFRLNQLLQYQNLVLVVVFFSGMIGLAKIKFQRIFYLVVIVASAITVVTLSFSRFFFSESLNSLVISIFGSLNVLFPISILFTFFWSIYDRERIHNLESSISIPISLLFLGSFFSQGWDGSSYALYPHLFLLFIIIFKVTQELFSKKRARVLFTVILVFFVLQLVWNISTGVRLGYVENAGLRAGSPNFEKIGIASGSKDIESLEKVNQVIASTGKMGTIVELPPEDSLGDIGNGLIPWGRCLQFMDVCPSFESSDLVRELKVDAPTFIILKKDPQFKFIPEAIPISGIKKCYKSILSTRAYSVLMKESETQKCLIGEY